jgi:predicted O-methyltransferase YrrM
MKDFPSPEVRRLLHELEEFGKAHDAREPRHARRMLNLEPDTAELMSILARSSRARRVLEIGTSNGYSTLWLAASIVPRGGLVTTIDRSAEKQQMARENLARVGLLKCVDFRCGEATEVISMLGGPFDFVLFDADRTSATAQLDRLLPKLAPAAVLLADNVLSHPVEIADYLAAIENIPHLQHAVVPVGKGLSVAFRWANSTEVGP